MEKNCNDCDIFKKKLEVYEKCFNDLRNIDNIQEKNTFLEESIIVEKDNVGNRVMKIPSDLTESFLVVDKGKNLNELNKNEEYGLKCQNDLHDYQKTKDYFKKAHGLYSFSYYVLKLSKWILLI
jgi:hypothetical protein